MISTELGYAISLALIALVVLILSASKGVEKVLALSHHYGIDATFVGLTIFSITTSFPEIFAHLTASVNILAGTMNYKVVSGTVLGANIGSDVIQQTLILGIIVLYQRSLVFTKDFLLSAYLPMIGTTLMCILLGWDGIYSRLDGIILFGTFLLYMIFLYKKEQHLHHAYSFHPAGEINIHKNVIIALLCMFLMFISAHFLLLATETVVSLTGLGASLIGVITIGVVSAAPTYLLGSRHGDDYCTSSPLVSFFKKRAGKTRTIGWPVFNCPLFFLCVYKN